jgi:AcrR family transcriptional regulator
MLSDRQQQIVEDSIKLIDEKGIQGFTIKNLAAEIGISEPGLYRHFKSKFEILRTILDSFKQMMTINRNQFIASDDDSVDKLHQLMNRILTVFTHSPALVSVIFAEEIFHNEHQLSEMVTEIKEINENLVILLYTQLQSQSRVNENISAEMFCLMYLGSIRLMVRNWKHCNYDFNLLDKGETLFQALMSGTKN